MDQSFRLRQRNPMRAHSKSTLALSAIATSALGDGSRSIPTNLPCGLVTSMLRIEILISSKGCLPELVLSRALPAAELLPLQAIGRVEIGLAFRAWIEI